MVKYPTASKYHCQRTRVIEIEETPSKDVPRRLSPCHRDEIHVCAWRHGITHEKEKKALADTKYNANDQAPALDSSLQLASPEAPSMTLHLDMAPPPYIFNHSLSTTTGEIGL